MIYSVLSSPRSFAAAASLAFAGATFVQPMTNSAGMTLVPVPAGKFVMGSEELVANWDERPLVPGTDRFYPHENPKSGGG